MPARPRRPLRLIAVGALVGLWLAGLGVSPAAAVAPLYSRDVYFVGSFERQIDSRTCTAASTAMMMNMIARRDLNLSQMTVLRFAQARDSLNNRVQRGSDPLGWSRAATYYSQRTARPTTYRFETFGSRMAALNRAASLIAWTGKPVGLLVQHGRHAVVMTGIRSFGNPNQTMEFRLLTIAISDPNGYTHRWYTGSTYATFGTYTQTDATPTYDRAWYGKYVIVAPQV